MEMKSRGRARWLEHPVTEAITWLRSRRMAVPHRVRRDHRAAPGRCAARRPRHRGAHASMPRIPTAASCRRRGASRRWSCRTGEGIRVGCGRRRRRPDGAVRLRSHDRQGDRPRRDSRAGAGSARRGARRHHRGSDRGSTRRSWERSSTIPTLRAGRFEHRLHRPASRRPAGEFDPTEATRGRRRRRRCSAGTRAHPVPAASPPQPNPRRGARRGRPMTAFRSDRRGRSHSTSRSTASRGRRWSRGAPAARG